MNSDHVQILEKMETLARAAGARILEIRAAGAAFSVKSDLSERSNADLASEQIIIDGLSQLFPAIPIVAEERASDGEVPRQLGDTFFLVDPLDGTREFKADIPEYAVNIALIHRARPILGVMYVPPQRIMYTTRSAGAVEISFQDGGVRNIRELKVARNGPLRRGVVSRSRPNESITFLRSLGLERFDQVGSTLKFCRVATGDADAYACIGCTSQWDTAAGDAILAAAGGMTTRLSDGQPLFYGRAVDDTFHNPDFIARRP